MVLDVPGGLFQQRDVRETPYGDLGPAQSVPIGAVLSWLKTFANTPSLPAGFVECNGQVLNDGESVYNGQTIPDLNGDNRFLRGNATSGATGGSSTHTLVIGEIPSHAHGITFGTATLTAGSDLGKPTTPSTDDLLTTAKGGGGAHENKPPYYNIVFIMRVK